MPFFSRAAFLRAASSTSIPIGSPTLSADGGSSDASPRLRFRPAMPAPFAQDEGGAFFLPFEEGFVGLAFSAVLSFPFPVPFPPELPLAVALAAALPFFLSTSFPAGRRDAFSGSSLLVAASSSSSPCDNDISLLSVSEASSSSSSSSTTSLSEVDSESLSSSSGTTGGGSTK